MLLSNAKSKLYNQKKELKNTLFFTLSILSLLIIIVTSTIMINSNGMNDRLQGWVNLLWLTLPILILIIDRIFIKKYETKRVNKFQFLVLLFLMLVFLINYIRLQLQS